MKAGWLVVLALLAPGRVWAQETLVVGSVTLTRCQVGYGAYCGSITRPLDPGGLTAGTISIGFEWYPRYKQALAPLGTIAAQEGGPGYSTTGSRDGYVRLFDALRDRRDILLMDKRGTGDSGPIDCPSLQRPGFPSAEDYRACGKQLGPAAWYYATRYAADDLAALLKALDRPRIDYYGDSYATYFGQAFLRQYPEMVRTAVLDSAYPDGVKGASAWFPTEYAVAPVALEKSCARSPTCAGLPGSPVDRLAALTASLRRAPLVGTAPDVSGALLGVTLDTPTLFMMLDFAGNSPILWRELDPAIRAWRDDADALPLLRLTAESVSGNDLGGNATAFSVGLATAVICADYPQLSDASKGPATRRAEYAAHVAAKMAARPGLYTPFTIPEAIAAPYQPLEVGVCVDWPKPPADAGPMPPQGDGPKLKVLVMNGELDTITSAAEGQDVARAFPGSQYVTIANSIHELAIGDAGYWVPPYGGDTAMCAGPMVLAFVTSGGAPIDRSCASQVRPIRMPAAFVRMAAQASLPQAMAGNGADETHLRIASAAAEAVGDVIARYYQVEKLRGLGLRGGSFTFGRIGHGYRFELSGVQWTDDLPVSGTIDWDQVSDDVVATVQVTGAATGTLQVSWNDRLSDAPATLTGTLDGQHVAATRLAP